MTGEYADREKRPEPERKERTIYDPMYEQPKPTSDRWDEEPIPGYGSDHLKNYPWLGFDLGELVAARINETEAEKADRLSVAKPGENVWRTPESIRAEREAYLAKNPHIAQRLSKRLDQNLPSGVFINASGGSLTDDKGGKAGLQKRVKAFAKGGTNTFFVPILTTDGKTGINTTDSNPNKVHRDRKYEYPGRRRNPFKEGTNTYWRDVVDETKDAVNASGKHVGKLCTGQKI
jgi:hypothetical protein